MSRFGEAGISGGSSNSATLDLFKETSSSDEVVLEGQLSGTSVSARGTSPGAPGFSTLDEPITDTILRDVQAVAKKFYHVLYPMERASLLKVRFKGVCL